eukprot:PhM_4_TR7265/c0_g1_i1/m.39265/K16195/EIF2AK2; eukaryotic translation initiation factor 2-alpha kinase 2
MYSVLMITTVDGVVHALDVESGDEAWSIDTGGPLVQRSLQTSTLPFDVPEPPIPDIGPSQALYFRNADGHFVPRMRLCDMHTPVIKLTTDMSMYTSTQHNIVQVNALSGAVESVDVLDPKAGPIPLSKDSLRVLRTTTTMAVVGEMSSLWRVVVGKVEILSCMNIKNNNKQAESENESVMPPLTATTLQVLSTTNTERCPDVDIPRVYINGDIAARGWTASMPSEIVGAALFVEGDGLRTVDVEEDASAPFVCGQLVVSGGHDNALTTMPGVAVYNYDGAPFIVHRGGVKLQGGSAVTSPSLQITAKNAQPLPPKPQRVRSYFDSGTTIDDSSVPPPVVDTITGNDINTKKKPFPALLAPMVFGVQDAVLESPVNSPVTPEGIPVSASQPQPTFYELQYEHIGVLGCGGCATVLEARHRITGNTYAVKVVKVPMRRRAQLLLEAQTHSQLDHPNVVRYYTSWEEHTFKDEYFGAFEAEDDDANSSYTDASHSTSKTLSPITYLCIQMQHYPTGSLADWLVRRRSIDPVVNRSIFHQLVSGLQYLHARNVVHCDLKPSNILVETNKDSDDAKSSTIHVRIGDFGLSLWSSEAAPSAAGQHHSTEGFGTPLYASPEQRRRVGPSSVGAASDVYSLGVILLELYVHCATQSERIRLLTALRKGEVVDETLRKRHPDVVELVLRMTRKDPASRIPLNEVLEVSI